MKTALITGVTGQDGRYLAELLSGKGYRIVGVSRSADATRAAPPNTEYRALDVSNLEAFSQLVAETKPREIYHFAAQSSVGVSFARPVETFHSIALTTLAVLEAARRADFGPRVLIAASGEVFGDTGGTAVTERSALRPLNPYSAAKAAACELAVSYRASYGLYASVLFFYNHESPLRGEQFVTKKIVRAACRIARGLERHVELGDTSVVRDWGWAEEYVAAAVRTLELDRPEDFVIATGESISLDEFIDAAFGRVGLRAADHVVSNRSLIRSVDIPVMRADPSKAEAMLGWRATVRGRGVAELLVNAELAQMDGKTGA